ncbi:MAG: hypothetical protein CVU93_02815 [Firmicutes bacterium HGW-Firmicutes-18]|nr:MAG: hypothetical protein CVU93_02815 [Firmicutes bacterium HGW-Firmicutes-18]
MQNKRKYQICDRIIDILRRTDDFEYNHLAFVYDTGDSPPEDVGGDYRYEHFLSVMSKPEDKEHENYKP